MPKKLTFEYIADNRFKDKFSKKEAINWKLKSMMHIYK